MDVEIVFENIRGLCLWFVLVLLVHLDLPRRCSPVSTHTLFLLPDTTRLPSESLTARYLGLAKTRNSLDPWVGLLSAAVQVRTRVGAARCAGVSIAPLRAVSALLLMTV